MGNLGKAKGVNLGSLSGFSFGVGWSYPSGDRG